MSQVGLSKRLGVSRTPLREALRMLQEEGLVEIERNRRARVASFDAEDLELVYASRILLSALATMLTVPRMTETEIAMMVQAIEQMKLCAEHNDSEGWRNADYGFHRIHCMFAPQSVQRELHTLFERATLYRLLRLRDQPHRQSVTFEDHKAILAACRARDTRAAIAAVARHLSRIALTLLAYTAPEREPQTIRAALQIALADHTAA
jgi:DNA-binding GntR family transcriptional regulator